MIINETTQECLIHINTFQQVLLTLYIIVAISPKFACGKNGKPQKLHRMVGMDEELHGEIEHLVLEEDIFHKASLRRDKTPQTLQGGLAEGVGHKHPPARGRPRRFINIGDSVFFVMFPSWCRRHFRPIDHLPAQHVHILQCAQQGLQIPPAELSARQAPHLPQPLVGRQGLHRHPHLTVSLLRSKAPSPRPRKRRSFPHTRQCCQIRLHLLDTLRRQILAHVGSQCHIVGTIENARYIHRTMIV